MTDDSPIRHDLDLRVLPEWIDFNGHMNIAYYVLAFDKATDNLFRVVAPMTWQGDDFVAGFYVVEMHINYMAELFEGDPLRVETQMLGLDDKRLHYFHTMYHAEHGHLAATNEILFLSVDRRTRRAAPMPDDIHACFAAALERHRDLPRPAQAGHVIAVKTIAS